MILVCVKCYGETVLTSNSLSPCTVLTTESPLGTKVHT